MNNQNDRILALTRVLAAIFLLFLWPAFFILYFTPETSGTRFAWTIKPELTAVYMGAGYLGGSWLFLKTLFGKRWHRVQRGFLPVTAFTWFMLAATFLHWERFAHGQPGFTLWLVVYVATPFLVPAVWLLNRRTDAARDPELNEVIIPAVLRKLVRLAGIAALLFVIAGFIVPDLFIRVWPWALTPLTARVIAGWGALLAVGTLGMAAEPRWSGWRTPLESILLWHLFFFAGMLLHRADLSSGLVNWFTLVTGGMLAVILVIYPMMERQRRKLARGNVALLERLERLKK